MSNWTMALMAVLAVAGCKHVEEVPMPDPGFDIYGDGIPVAYGSFIGVDVLVVVDNSGSMDEEQEILATAFFPLVNALTDPLPGWPHPAADDVRVAVVSSDMGLSWGGNPYEPGDGWPGDAPQGCGSAGDDGEFQTYGSGKVISLEHDAIPCDASASQCPTDWTCDDFDGDVGTCQAPGGDGSYQTCPELSATFAQTPLDPPDDMSPNDELAFQVACLSALGTNGCGFEQQLQAAARALEREDQQDFVRPGALLAVIEVSDEEDCSIESNELFTVDEIQDLADGKVNIACGNHPQHLYDPLDFAESFLAAKGHQPGSVLFAAIAGVPEDAACEGTGDQIPDCLDHPHMSLDVVQENEAWFFEPACARYEGDELVTKARPGRRFVKLVQHFGNAGYAFSICNADWLPAAEDIASMIATRLEGECFPEQLPWDQATQVSPCHLFVSFDDKLICPFPTDPGADPVEETYTDESNISHTRLHCPLPRVAAPLACDQADPEGLGWRYCENPDADSETCPYEVRPTPAGLQAILGRPAAIRCPL